MDFSESLTWTPVGNLRDFGLVRSVSFICTEVSNNDHFQDTEDALGAGPCAADIYHSLDKVGKVLEVFPDEPADAWVVGNSFVPSAGQFVVGDRTFDTSIVKEGDGYMGDLRLKYEGNVCMKSRNGVGPSHGDSGESIGSDRG